MGREVYVFSSVSLAPLSRLQGVLYLWVDLNLGVQGTTGQDSRGTGTVTSVRGAWSRADYCDPTHPDSLKMNLRVGVTPNDRGERSHGNHNGRVDRTFPSWVVENRERYLGNDK